MDIIEDRDALYYPYIHIRDVNWLKATLLCFPQVRRMVPPDFFLNDAPEVQQFRAIIGSRNEPLISEESTDTSTVEQAQQRLLSKLRADEDTICRRFSRSAAMATYAERSDSFQMHRGKFGDDLFSFLEGKDLAWLVRGTQGGDRWYALHPELGETVMSIIAISIATAKGLDIVTSSGRIHHALASLDETEVFDQFLKGQWKTPHRPGIDKSTELANELAELVLTTKFDVSRLTPAQIGELIKDGKDLRQFKNALKPIVDTIPDIPDPDERIRRLRIAAQEVIDQWNEYKKSLPRFAADALLDVSNLKLPEFFAGLVAGAPTVLTLASGLGIAIGVVTYSGYGILRKYRENIKNPYRYLSHIEKAGASLSVGT